MKSFGIKLKKFLIQIYVRYRDDNISDLSARLSFFLLLSMFPFLLFLLSLISYTPISAVEFTENIEGIMPKETGKLITEIIGEMLKARSAVLLSVSAIIIIWSASGGISALSKGLNKAYDKDESRSFLRIRLMSVVFIIGIAALIIITLLFLVFGGVIGSYISGLFSRPDAFIAFWGALRYAIPLLVMFLTFTLIYIFVPCCGIKLKEALPGAIFSTTGWIITSLLFSFYINNFTNYTRLYGSIAGIVILLIWIYISCIIILLGGEVNATFLYFKNNTRIDKYENQNIFPDWLKKRFGRK